LPLEVGGVASYCRRMKRFLIISVAVWLGGGFHLPAQSGSSASNGADQQAAAERYQKLAGKVQDLAEAQEALQKRLAALAAEIRALREEQAQPNTDMVSREELKRLAEKVQEIDQKREEDKELILKEITRLAKTISTPAAGPQRKPVADTTPATGGEKSYEGYEYVVKSGDTLMAIVSAYKEQGIKVTVEQIVKHPLNAKLDPNKLRVGQKIFIPAK
jgi:nucleoid-associated protein YgaU